MTLDAVANFIKLSVVGTYTALATDITVGTGQGATLPTPPFNMVWYNNTNFGDPGDDGFREIIRVVSILGDVLTVSRGQEGISATAKDIVGVQYKLLLAFTKKSYDELSTATTVADSSSATTWPLLHEAVTGTLSPKTDAGLTYDASTANLSTTTFTGALAGNATTSTNTTGNAATVTVADAGEDTTTYPLLGIDLTGNMSPRTDAGLSYQGTTNALTATTFIGALTGTATGNYTPGGTDVAVTDGGTGISATIAYTPVCGGTTTTAALQSVASIGSAGQVLMSNGAGALPTFQTYTPYIGVTWDESADTYTRTGGLAGVAVGSSPGNALLPIQASMRRCVMNDSGVVQYYLDSANSTKKKDGSASVLTGADGQVMVEIPRFYYSHSLTGNVHEWDVSLTPFSGSIIHPAFVKDGVEVAFRYIGAYEGTLYDTSASIYTDGIYQTAVSCVFDTTDDSLTIASRSGVFSKLTVGDKIVVTGTTNNNATLTVASLVSATKITVSENLVNETAAATVIQTQKDWTATTGDKLASVSEKAPINYGTRANFRVAAANRGTGWRQQDFYLASAIQLLYLIEYGSFNSQSVIGNGLTDWGAAWPEYNDYNPINNTGISNAKGNTTFNLSNGDGVVGSYMIYRGIENWYGHIWKWVDGMNINANRPYVSNTRADFADDTTTNYTDIGVNLINADGYQSTLVNIDTGFLPASVEASSSTKITDYYYQGAGWRVGQLGGSAFNGLYAGACYWDLDDTAAILHQGIGGRLAY